MFSEIFIFRCTIFIFVIYCKSSEEHGNGAHLLITDMSEIHYDLHRLLENFENSVEVVEGKTEKVSDRSSKNLLSNCHSKNYSDSTEDPNSPNQNTIQKSTGDYDAVYLASIELENDINDSSLDDFLSECINSSDLSLDDNQLIDFISDSGDKTLDEFYLDKLKLSEDCNSSLKQDNDSQTAINTTNPRTSTTEANSATYERNQMLTNNTLERVQDDIDCTTVMSDDQYYFSQNELNLLDQIIIDMPQADLEANALAQKTVIENEVHQENSPVHFEMGIHDAVYNQAEDFLHFDQNAILTKAQSAFNLRCSRENLLAASSRETDIIQNQCKANKQANGNADQALQEVNHPECVVDIPTSHILINSASHMPFTGSNNTESSTSVNKYRPLLVQSECINTVPVTSCSLIKAHDHGLLESSLANSYDIGGNFDTPQAHRQGKSSNYLLHQVTVAKAKKPYTQTGGKKRPMTVSSNQNAGLIAKNLTSKQHQIKKRRVDIRQVNCNALLPNSDIHTKFASRSEMGCYKQYRLSTNQQSTSLITVSFERKIIYSRNTNNNEMSKLCGGKLLSFLSSIKNINYSISCNHIEKKYANDKSIKFIQNSRNEKQKTYVLYNASVAFLAFASSQTIFDNLKKNLKSYQKEMQNEKQCHRKRLEIFVSFLCDTILQKQDTNVVIMKPEYSRIQIFMPEIYIYLNRWVEISDNRLYKGEFTHDFESEMRHLSKLVTLFYPNFGLSATMLDCQNKIRAVYKYRSFIASSMEKANQSKFHVNALYYHTFKTFELSLDMTNKNIERDIMFIVAFILEPAMLNDLVKDLDIDKKTNNDVSYSKLVVNRLCETEEKKGKLVKALILVVDILSKANPSQAKLETDLLFFVPLKNTTLMVCPDENNEDILVRFLTVQKMLKYFYEEILDIVMR